MNFHAHLEVSNTISLTHHQLLSLQHLAWCSFWWLQSLKMEKKKKIRRQAILWCLEGLFPFHPFSTQTLWLKIEVQFFYLDGLQGGWRENFTSIGLHWWWKLHSETVCSALKAQQPFPVCLPLCVLFLCKTFSLPETPVHQQHLPLFILLFAI